MKYFILLTMFFFLNPYSMGKTNIFQPYNVRVDTIDGKFLCLILNWNTCDEDTLFFLYASQITFDIKGKTVKVFCEYFNNIVFQNFVLLKYRISNKKFVFIDSYLIEKLTSDFVETKFSNGTIKFILSKKVYHLKKRSFLQDLLDGESEP